jgi:hypothetical protein
VVTGRTSRAKQVGELLQAVGIAANAVSVKWQDKPESVDGVDDYESRRVTILVKP